VIKQSVLKEYFLKSNSSSFFKQVYLIVRKIPTGQVLTYGQIATLLGAPHMARQVGWAMHGCPLGLAWYRVVGAKGRILTNSSCPAGGSQRQRQLLEQEAVTFLGQYVDLKRHQCVLSKKSFKGSCRI